MRAIYERELGSYFHSMLGYVFIAIVSAFIGLYYFSINLFGGYPSFSMALGNTTAVFLFAVPLLTMRSMAEDRRSRTDQMLLTYPVTITRVVLGKFFAMATVLLIPMVLCCYYPLIIAANGTATLLNDYSAILAYFCLGCLYLAVGQFFSSLTESQLIAAVGTFAALLVSYLWEGLASLLPTTAQGSLAGLLILCVLAWGLTLGLSGSRVLALGVGLVCAAACVIWYIADSAAFAGLLGELMGHFSLLAILDNFAYYQVFDLGGLLQLISLTALFLFLTVQSVSRRRWS